MRKKLFLGAIICTTLAAFAAKDPVIMKINGKDVKLSEFEYLYHKNNQQQIEKESLDKYVERFVVYKLKVADAEEAKLDTLRSFRDEFNGYKRDLSKPYLEDTMVTERLARECYDRMLKNVDVTNIYLAPGKDEAAKRLKHKLADSLYQCLKNGEDMEQLAFKHSEDRMAKTRKGKMGYVRVGMLPYVFEEKAFNTPVGQFTEPFESRFGIHILKVNAVRDDNGKVLAEHILKLYPANADAKAKEEVFNKVKALYDRVKAGENFEELAKKESEDPGSASKGGKLPLFGTGEMVPEFEKVSFELADGEISEPFETAYGVHIVKKISHKGVGTYQENEKNIKSMIQRDERATMAKDAKLDEIKAKYRFKENANLDDYVNNLALKAAGNDSLFVAQLKNSDIEAFSYDGKKVMLSEVAQNIKPRKTSSVEGEKMAVRMATNAKEEECLTDLYISELYKNDNNFHNLLNEYRDGMLLFEISNQKIWEGAAKDKNGLEKYFQEHRSNYTWNTPKYKGTVILATNDSVMSAVKYFLAGTKDDKQLSALKKEFKNNIKVEKVFAEEGENVFVDYLVFNKGDKPKLKKYAECYLYDGKLLNQPEDATDVRVQVTNDYQAELEKNWINELKAKYPVEINKNVLKKVKE